jgi:hypothetical protein
MTDARRRLTDAEDRARAAEERASAAQRELEAAADPEARALREHELDVHRRAAATHRAGVELQREHIDHESRLAEQNQDSSTT